MPSTLDEWLSYIEALHPKSIEMGLDRVRLVRDYLGIELAGKVITVAGTNGKGSTAAMLSSCYLNAGYQVGCYTSPHFLQYNERLTINQVPVVDKAFCQAFEVVEAARMSAKVSLTYFEFGTLAAVWLMSRASLDVAILEVGLGGRLDAVNIFDSDCAIVTNIALDHQDFLGDTRESIAREKAGVYRTNKPAICGDHSPPETLLAYAKEINTSLMCIGDTFKIVSQEDGYRYTYKPLGNHSEISLKLPRIGLSGTFQSNNAACALTAIYSLQQSLPIPDATIQAGIAEVKVVGRYEKTSLSKVASPMIIYDVAHNPNAAEALAGNLASDRTFSKRTLAVFSMLHNKDWAGVIRAVEAQIDVWYLGQIDHVRGADIQSLANVILEIKPNAKVHVFDNIPAAIQEALVDGNDCIRHDKNDRILVFGSFFTVSEVKQFFRENQGV